MDHRELQMVEKKNSHTLNLITQLIEFSHGWMDDEPGGRQIASAEDVDKAESLLHDAVAALGRQLKSLHGF